MTSTNLLFSSMPAAQQIKQIVEQAERQLADFSLNENLKIQKTDSLVKNIAPIFQEVIHSNSPNKELTGLLKKTITCIEPNLNLPDSTETTTIEEYIEQCAKRCPAIIQRLFPHLNPLAQMIQQSLQNDSQVSLDHRVKVLWEKLPKTEDALDLFINKITAATNFSDEQKKTAFQILAKIFSESDQFQLLQNYIFEHKDINPLLAIETVKIAAVLDPEKTTLWLKKFRITDQQALVEVIKMIAVRNSHLISQNIHEFGVKDEEDRLKIAKITAAQDGMSTSECIRNFCIKDQSGLIQIAKIAAAQNGAGVSEYIQDYDIFSEDARIEIAAIAASQDGMGTAQRIRNYAIKDEQGRFRIAKNCAAQNGIGISLFFKYFHLEKMHQIVEVAKTAAIQDGEGAILLVHMYGIKKEEDLFSVYLTAAIYDQKALRNFERSNFSDAFYFEFFKT